MLEMREQEELHIKKPFPGLRPFQPDETLIFFGRDGLSGALLKKLRSTRFVAVVGTSGSGKSSLVNAGLLPALRGGLMKGAGSAWRIAVFRPINNPIRNLAQALAKTFTSTDVADEPTKSRREILIEQTLRRSSLGLIDAVRKAMMSASENLLIVVDQFEELYRFEPSPEVEHPQEEASAFVKLLLESTQQEELPIYVILTMRSDYLGDSAQFWRLPEAINKGQFLIPRMIEDERREAIEGPIKVFDGKISPTLVNRLLNEVGDAPAGLPILQHALMRTWDYWQKHRHDSEPIGIKHFDNPVVGGLTRALSLHADEAYEELSENQKIIAQKLFRRLTEKTAGKRERRVSATVREIKEVVDVTENELLPVIEAFRQEGRSFLMPPVPTPLTEDTLIDISHESLISGWTGLSKWVEDEADSAKTYQRLIDDALRYPKHTKLLSDPELEATLLWRKRERPNEVWAKRYATEFGKALASSHPPARPAWAGPDDTEFQIAMRYLDLSESARTRRRIFISLAFVAAIILIAAFVILEYSRVLETANASALEARRAKEDEERTRELYLQADALRTSAEQLQRLADDRAIQAEKDRKLAADALVIANTQRDLAEQRGRQLSEFTKLGEAMDNVLAAMSSGNTNDIVDAYQTMRKLYETAGFRNKTNQDELDDLTIAAILRDGDWSPADAFPYFKEKYFRSFAREPNALAYANISFARLVVESDDRQDVEAGQFLTEAISLLDDQKDTLEKARAELLLARILGNSPDAIDAYSRAIELLHKSDSHAEEEADTRVSLGDVYKQSGNYEKAIDQYSQAQSILNKVLLTQSRPEVVRSKIAKVNEKIFMTRTAMEHRD